jgi:hypothetical protein
VLKITNEEIEKKMRNKLRQIEFALVVYGLLETWKKIGYADSTELAGMTKVSPSTIRKYLGELRMLDYIYCNSRNTGSNPKEWRGTKNGDSFVLEKFLPDAIETIKKAGLWGEEKKKGR